MAHFYKVKTGWRAQLEKAGVRHSKTFTLKADAVAWSVKLEAEINGQARAGLSSDTRTFHELLDRFSRTECPKRKGHDTEVKRLEYLKRQIPDVPLREVTTTLIAEWRDERLKTIGPGSMRREMTLLRTVLDVARREWKLFLVNPITDVRKPPAPPHRTRLITQDEINGMVRELRYHDEVPITQVQQVVGLMFLLAIETGMRASEIPAAVVKGQVAYLKTTKNGDAREVPLSKRAIELFARVPDGISINEGSRQSLFNEARIRAGLSGFTFHDSRAVALTRMAKKLTVMELAKVVGQRDPRSLMIYYREPTEAIADKLG